MEILARLIADLIGIDLVYGYLVVGILIGIVIGALVVRPSRSRAARDDIGGGRRDIDNRIRSSAVTNLEMQTASGTLMELEINGQKFDVNPEAAAQVRQYLSDGKKIEAIKVLREATGLGFAEAKNMVEIMERTMTLRM